MNVRTRIRIAASPHAIFDLARATERWPQLLPHYRSVRVLERDGGRRVLEMAAKRPFSAIGMWLPVRWRAEQIDDGSKPEIFFRHLAGWTKGMRVWWHFVADGDGTFVEIEHDLRSPIAPFIAHFFIDPIARRTLARFKQICEGGS